MNISPNEAEESLEAIQTSDVRNPSLHCGGGSYIFLIITGFIWLVGFLATQFLRPDIATYIWIGASLLGSVLAILLGSRQGQRVRGASFNAMTKRAMLSSGCSCCSTHCHHCRCPSSR
jgi:hypothetical protein